MRIPMEDWLRGCVYHDGRHGDVTLPTDKVLEIADYIQLTRTSQTDGCIELPPYTADTPQTDWYCSITEDRDTQVLDAWQVEQMQTDCGWGEPR